VPLGCLSETDRQTICECLRAAATGSFFDGWEFQPLFGLYRDEVKEIASRAPHIDDSDANVSLAINNAIANLSGYPWSLDKGSWSDWVSVHWSELPALLERWRRTFPSNSDG
jgi:hypothetical protein